MPHEHSDAARLAVPAAPGKISTHLDEPPDKDFSLTPPSASQLDLDQGVPITDTVEAPIQPSDTVGSGPMGVSSSSRSGLSTTSQTGEADSKPLLPSFDLTGVAEHIQQKGAKRIVCMCGAGISVSAGIPDFRSPGTGLYDNLERYNLPRPSAVFELDYFRQNPEPFYQLAKELYPGNFKPTPTHHFMRLLHDKGLLTRVYTQNIDSLEALAGIPADKVIAAHGNFDSARCISCKSEAHLHAVKASVMDGKVHRCAVCDGLVKPDIVFFGENLPERFFTHKHSDLREADLLLIMGTSLVVYPFAGLTDEVLEHCPRLLINREVVGEIPAEMHALGYKNGLWFGDGNTRDAKYLGECDAGVMALAEHLGWADELQHLVAGVSDDTAAAEANAARVADAVGAAVPQDQPAANAQAGSATRATAGAAAGPAQAQAGDERAAAEALAAVLEAVELEDKPQRTRS